MSQQWQQLLGFALVFVVVPVAVLVIVFAALMLYRRKGTITIERSGRPAFSRTFSFSIGTPPDPLPDGASLDVMQQTQPIDPNVRERYRRYWERAKDRFDRNPVEGLKEAEDLLTDLMKERGSSGVSLSGNRVAAMDLVQAVDGISDIFGGIDKARAAARGFAAVKDGSGASDEDLRQAMAVYESAFEKLIAE